MNPIAEMKALRAENEQLKEKLHKFNEISVFVKLLDMYRDDEGWVRIEKIVNENEKLRAQLVDLKFLADQYEVELAKLHAENRE